MNEATDAAIDLLQRAGAEVGIRSAAELLVDGRSATVKVRARPTPSDLARELSRWRTRDRSGRLAYIVRKATPSLAAVAMQEPSVILIGVDNSTLVRDGELIRLGEVTEPPRAASRRVAWGRLALVRTLLRTPEPRTQRQLAGEAGITQAAVSKALAQLGEVAVDARHGSVVAAEALWQTFATEYPGARGIRSHWFSLDTPVRQAASVQQASPDTLVSGDAGADRLAPWRVVGSAVVYARAGLDLAALGFAAADADEASLTVTVPADSTLWATASAWAAVRETAMGVADPLIVAHDVRVAGGSDAAEAVERLHDVVLEPWRR